MARTGIFVIATKHSRGTMVANPAASTWTPSLGPCTSRLQHPLRQQDRHIQARQQVLDCIPARPIHALVVCTGTAVCRPQRPLSVCDVAGVVRYLLYSQLSHRVNNPTVALA